MCKIPNLCSFCMCTTGYRFCYSVEVARRLQLNRGIYPVLLKGASASADPYSGSARMGLLRTEMVRTAKEAGWIQPGDRIAAVDRNRGKVTDSFHIGTNVKIFTIA